MLNYSNISPQEESRILDFLNKAESVDDILNPNILYDDPSSGLGDQINDPTIGALVALRILEKRDAREEKVFTKLEQLDDIQGFGQDKLQDLVFSLTAKISTPQPIPLDTPSSFSSYEPKEDIKLEDKDIGNLEKVLRSYYLTQINTLEGWKNRRLARELIEDHLVLPKSQQRTSKDGAYIKEKLGMEGFLLERLEDTRLIRKISRRGINPIYEVSHDTLVEPILAEKRNKAMFWIFMKKWGKYLAALLLLVFLMGMCVGPPSLSNIYNINLDPVIWNPGDSNVKNISIPYPVTNTINNKDTLKINLTLFHNKTKVVEEIPRIPINLDTLESQMPQDHFRVATRGSDEMIFIDYKKELMPVNYTVVEDNRQVQKKIFADIDVIFALNLPQKDTTVIDSVTILKIVPDVHAAHYPTEDTIKTELVLSDYFMSDSEDQLARNFLEGKKFKLILKRNIYPIVKPEIKYVPSPPEIIYRDVEGIDLRYADGSRRPFPNSGRSNLPNTHTVRKGETISSISRKYNLKKERLLEINKLNENSIIPVGKVLNINP